MKLCFSIRARQLSIYHPYLTLTPSHAHSINFHPKCVRWFFKTRNWKIPSRKRLFLTPSLSLVLKHIFHLLCIQVVVTMFSFRFSFLVRFSFFSLICFRFPYCFCSVLFRFVSICAKTFYLYIHIYIFLPQQWCGTI